MKSERKRRREKKKGRKKTTWMKKQKLLVKFKLLHRHFIIFLRFVHRAANFFNFRKFSSFGNSCKCKRARPHKHTLIHSPFSTFRTHTETRKSKRHEWERKSTKVNILKYILLVMNVCSKVVLSSDVYDDNDENYATKFTVELMFLHETNVNAFT